VVGYETHTSNKKNHAGLVAVGLRDARSAAGGDSLMSCKTVTANGSEKYFGCPVVVYCAGAEFVNVNLVGAVVGCVMSYRSEIWSEKCFDCKTSAVLSLVASGRANAPGRELSAVEFLNEIVTSRRARYMRNS
jgi:hypothetical protein